MFSAIFKYLKQARLMADAGCCKFKISQRFNNVRDEELRRTLCPIQAAVTGAVLLNRDD